MNKNYNFFLGLFLFIGLNSMLHSKGTETRNLHERVSFDSPLCSISEIRYGNNSSKDLLIFFNGIPVTSLIYEDLAQSLIEGQVPQQILRVDLPGTGASHMSSLSAEKSSRNSVRATKKYSWSRIRRCIDHYFQEKTQQGYRLNIVLHDIAGPIILPLMKKYENDIDSMTLFNTIIQSHDFKPIFPLNLVKLPLIGLGASLASGKLFYTHGFLKDGVSDKSVVPRIHEIYEEFKKDFGKTRLHRLMRGFELSHDTDRKILEGLEAINKKLIIWAPEDPSLGYQKDILEELLPQQKVHSLPEAKHFLMVDHYRAIAEKMIPFLFSI